MRPREVQPLQQRTAQLYPGEVRPLQQQTARPRQPCKLRSWEVRLLQHRQTGTGIFFIVRSCSFILVQLILLLLCLCFLRASVDAGFGGPTSGTSTSGKRPAMALRRWKRGLFSGGRGG